MTQQQFKEITDWQKQTFPNATALSKLAHLKKELPELNDAILNDQQNVPSEFADCFFLLFGSAAACGFSYEQIIEAIDNKFSINKQRQWGKPDADGVVEHVR